jgi:flagellar protein FlbD
MIKVTDVSGKEKFLNCDLIERVESIPDTLITLLTGRNLIVKESPEEIVEKVSEFKRRCNAAASPAAARIGGAGKEIEIPESAEESEK